jgi:hypothetical protein
MVKGMPSVHFNPDDDLILDLLKGRGYCVILDNGLTRFAEIYFSQKDAYTFNNKMNQSLSFAI